MGKVVAYNPGPNRATRRSSRMPKRHMSKSYSKGRASWNWRGGCFGSNSITN